MAEQFQVGEKTYNNEELFQIGKLHFPKRYWIKRGIGIALWVVALEYSVSIPFTTIFWAFQIDNPARAIVLVLIFSPLAILFVAGLIMFILSFRPEARDVYIDYGKKYLSKQEANSKARDIKLERRRYKELANYKKLLDRGVITQEEFDKKKEELTK